MFSYTCKICGEKFSHEKDAYAIRKFVQHIGEEHQLSKKEYIVQYELNGNIPLCACGCGTPVEIAKGWNKWNKYYADHKNYDTVSQEARDKLKEAAKRKLDQGDFDDIPVPILEKSLKDFKRGLSLADIELIYGFDRRTIRRNWISRKIITEEEIKELSLVTKYSGPKKRSTRLKLGETFFEDVHEFIINNKYRYTINEINRIFGFKLKHVSLVSGLKDKYGDEIFDYVIFGQKSKEEVYYLQLLQFFFGKKNVKLGYSVESRIFDSLIYNNILLEYDGSYYHSTEEQLLHDQEKTKIAKQNGYRLLRVNENSSKSLFPLIKIIIWKNIDLLKLKVLKILGKVKNLFMI